MSRIGRMFCRHNWLIRGSIQVAHKGVWKHLVFYRCDKCGATKSEDKRDI